MNAHDIGHARAWLDDSTDTEHPDDARAASTISEALDLTVSTWLTCYGCLELVPEDETSRSGLCHSCGGADWSPRPTLSDALGLLLSFLNAEDSYDIGQTALRVIDAFGVGICGSCLTYFAPDEYDNARGSCFSCLDANADAECHPCRHGHFDCSTTEGGRCSNED
jgi:hypothetical protein